ncbi:diguanylate cyclase [Acerihabitans sp. TG2]|uniref:sensor domain-containing diguanylate cyclase n=1 Tax=Acerihabitans sp. TG2 TaxID=3096008 RepID=UPI002B22FAB1|nr:diguanylate cyclase [Acerihabitans sp. TG2]MEA9389004.1 diguanylate cyclase [Acerihabitans sp. TG2]
MFREIADTKNKPKLSSIKVLLDQAVMVSITDANGVILYVNKLFCKTSGYAESELVGQTHKLLSSRTHDAKFFDEMNQTINAGKIWRNEVCNKSKNGLLYWEDITIIPQFAASGVIKSFVTVRINVTRQVQNREKLYQQSYYDAMTNVLNRQGFYNKFSHVIKEIRHHQKKIYLAIFDIDNFKLINDSYGHAAGDAVLKLLTTRITAVTKGSAILGRLGGDEFILLFTHISDEHTLTLSLNRLMQIVTRPFKLKHIVGKQSISISMGVATYPIHGLKLPGLMKKADLCLYNVKNAGGNNYQLHSNTITSMFQHE